jgi:AcrR family transcriptional regulator
MSSGPIDATAPAGRRERRKREIHDRILEAAVSLFEEKGFAATTAVEIAAVADVAEKTFYNHFASKQTLTQELAEESLARLREMLEQARACPGSIAERLEHFFRRAAQDAEHGSRGLTRELILELVRASHIEGIGPERNRHLHGCFADLLRDGVEQGELDPALDVEFFTELCVASYTGIIMNWVSVSDYPLQSRLLAAARFLGDAIRAVPPIAATVRPTPIPQEARE